MVFGTFDLLHPGHLFMLNKAKKLGYYLIVIIARDKTVTEIKGKQPVNSELKRLRNIKKLGLANFVKLGNIGANKYSAITKFKPNIVALGYDQKNFTNQLIKNFPKTKIVRLKSYKPHIYKSSKLNKK